MKNLMIVKTKIIFFFFAQIFAYGLFAQLPQNINKQFGWQISGTVLGAGSQDWIYSVKSLSSGGFIATGYSLLGAVQNPIIIKLDASGNVLWEQNIACVEGYGVDIYELPTGYIVIGEGTRLGGCADPRSVFSILVDKITGVIDPTFGLKLYNDQTISLPAPQNGQAHTEIGSFGTGKCRSCEIKSPSGQPAGFMICGNYNDNSIPSMSFAAMVTAGGFLFKIDINGKPDVTFGNGGVVVYFKNTGSSCRNTHLHNVCVNYDSGGNAKGYVVVGSINETTSTIPQWGWIDTDALLFMTDQAGAVTFTDVYDEGAHFKTSGSPVSYPYTDVTDPTMCANNGGVNSTGFFLTQENNTQKATGVKQIVNGGDFIVLSQFDHTLFMNSSMCGFTYPQTGFFGIADPCVSRVSQSGSTLWSTNLVQSSGADFENALLIDATTGIFVLGSSMTEPLPGTPIEQQAVISRVNFTGSINYERVYSENANSQTMICPFTFDFISAAPGGIIIAGDNDLNVDDYNFIGYSPF